jgi:hypothetical protein
MPGATEFNPGYAIDKENREAFKRLPVASSLLPMRGSFDEVRLDPREMMQVENQGSVGACFPAGALVHTLSRGRCPIEQVKTGDLVTTHTGKLRAVVRTMNRQFTGDMITIRCEKDRQIVLTEDHQIRVHRANQQLWVAASDVVTTDKLIDPNLETGTLGQTCPEGRLFQVESIQSHAVEDVTVYDFEVEHDHSFVCMDFIVHNCQGHSLSSVTEWCYAIATKGQMVQLSRAMAYYETQRIDKLSGDVGSTVDGGKELILDVGLCEEILWKYTGSYDPRRPANFDAIKTNAAKYRLAQAMAVLQYEQGRVFLGSGAGGIHMGISWGGGMDTDKVESFRPGNGGHSICALCLGEEVDRNGDPYWWIMNSWSKQWGSRKYPGWQCWSPTAIRQMLAHKWTVMIGLSDMRDIKPRVFGPDEWKKKLRPFG